MAVTESPAMTRAPSAVTAKLSQRRIGAAARLTRTTPAAPAANSSATSLSLAPRARLANRTSWLDVPQQARHAGLRQARPVDGVEAAPDGSQRSGRQEEARRVEEQQVGWRDEGYQHSGENRPENLAGRVRGHDPSVGGNQVVPADQAGDRRELAAVEQDPQRGLDEGNGVDLLDPKRPGQCQQGEHDDHGGPARVGEQHHPLAIDAVCHGSQHQPEQQVGHEFGDGGQRQVGG
jgi:hypothetical protein